MPAKIVGSLPAGLIVVYQASRVGSPACPWEVSGRYLAGCSVETPGDAAEVELLRGKRGGGVAVSAWQRVNPCVCVCRGWLISAIAFVVRFQGIPAGTGALLAVCAVRGVGVCAGALEYLGQELLDAPVAWVVEERAGRLILDDLAFVEHDDPVGHLVGEA